MEIRQLEYFIAVAELLSFSKAAARCCVVQPTISHQVANLEEELGVRLLERNRRSICLTRAGELVLEEARGIVAKTNDIFRKLDSLKNESSCVLRVGYYSACIDPVFGARLYDCAHACDVELRLEHMDFYRGVFFEKLLDGEFDIVITLGDVYRLYEGNEDIRYVPLYSAQVKLAVQAGHPLACCGPEISRAQVKKHCDRVLIYAPSYSKEVCRRGILWYSEAFDIPENRIEIATSTLEMQMEIEAGNAVGIMLETEIRSLNAKDRLVVLNVAGAPQHEIGIAFCACRAGGLIETFLENIREA